MGAIYRRGRFWWIKYYRNGKGIYESTKVEKKTVAERILKQREGEIAEGKIPGHQFDKVAFEELADDLLNDYRVNGLRSLDKTARRVGAHLMPFFGNIRASHIATATVKAYITKRMDEGASNATINRELAALKRMFNLGARQTPAKVSRDNMPYIPMLAENNVRQGFFEHDQFLALRDALPEHLRGFVTFGYKTGCRYGEIQGLEWHAVNRKEGLVRLEGSETKNKEPRWIPLDHELQEIVGEQFRMRRLDCPYVFHRDGKHITDIRAAWKSACQAIDCEGMLFHDLRRTAIRNMVRAGVPEQVAMRISGHKTRSVFDRYNIVNDHDLKQAAFQQEAYLMGKLRATVTK